MGPSRRLRAFSRERKRGSAERIGGAVEVDVERIMEGSGVESFGVEM